MKKKYSRILGVALTLVLLASFFGFAAPVSAANVAWSGIANPSTVRLNLADCDVGPIAVTPDGNTLFAAVETEAAITGVSTAAGQWALLQSTDGGHNWTATGLIMNPGPITGIAVSSNFATDGTMYVAAWSGTLGTPAVFRTNNSGTTFTEIKAVTAEATGPTPTTAINSIDMWPASPYPYVMVGTDTDVWVLQDAPFGVWRDQEVNAAGPVNIVAVAFAPDFATTNYIWAVTAAGNVTTTNSPGAWGTILGNALLGVAAISADIGFPDNYSSMTAPYLWVALNSGGLNTGGVWRIRGLPVMSQAIPQLPTTDVRSIAVSGSMATATILAGQENSALISKSVDGGVMWRGLILKQPTGGGITYVVMAPDFATSNLAYVGTSDLVTLVTGGVLGTAEWSTDYARSGIYSVELSAPASTGDYGKVVMPLDMEFEDFVDFSVWVEGGAVAAQALPLLDIKAVVDDVAGVILPASNKATGAGVDLAGKIVVLASQPGQSEGLSPPLVSDSIAGFQKYGTHSDADIKVGSGTEEYWSIFVYSDLYVYEAAYDYYTWDQIYAVLDGKATVTEVRVELRYPQAPADVASTVYVDDITINDVTYNLEQASSAFQVSGNAGMSWNQTGLIDTTIATINDVAVVSLDTIFMVTDTSDLWKTEDATATAPVWERILTSATVTYPMHTLANITFVETSPEFATDGVVYAADSVTGIVKAIDGGSIFAPLPPPALAAITALHVVDATFAFLGEVGDVYRTDDGGYSWLPATTAPPGATDIVSIATSPAGAMPPGQLLVGDANGGVFMSMNRGVTFFPLGYALTTGNASVAFDAGYATNSTVYAGGGDVIKRFNVAVPTAPWVLIDFITGGTMPAGSTITGLVTSPDGTLYGSNAAPGQGMERSLNPTAALTAPVEGAIAPVFESATSALALAAGATFNGLWLRVDETLDVVGSKNVLFSINTAPVAPLPDQIMTYTDTLATPVVLAAPEDGAVFPREAAVTLEWETLTGARSYYWQIARDAAFMLPVQDGSGFTGYPSDSFTGLDAGRTYYWRVRVDGPDITTGLPGAPGLPVLSRWSETRTFTTLLGERPWHPFSNIGGVAPAPGAQDVLTKPTFQWNGADWATSYQLVLADNAAFTGATTKTLTTTSWVSDTDLGYSTTWYWKVIALSATSESEWSDVGVFTTMAEPAPPVVVEEVQPPVIEVIIPEQPAAVEVTPVAPAYLLAMIIIGAVLVIFVVVLIVRTRRPV